MNKDKYAELFTAFGKAPMKKYLELMFDDVSQALKELLWKDLEERLLTALHWQY